MGIGLGWQWGGVGMVQEELYHQVLIEDYFHTGALCNLGALLEADQAKHPSF